MVSPWYSLNLLEAAAGDVDPRFHFKLSILFCKQVLLVHELVVVHECDACLLHIRCIEGHGGQLKVVNKLHSCLQLKLTRL